MHDCKPPAASRSIKRDLDAAAAVQRSLLPAALPGITGIRFAWKFCPCQELAGDFLNVLPLADHHIGLYILAGQASQQRFSR
jgi:sigma-B regulation protein RsbU (phosphoserine phosphatase)